jgi:DHA1 family multidrug resistance protein-like MFS transporter
MAPESSAVKTSNRKNLLILAFTLAVIMLGFGMVIPIMPFYVERMGASGTELGLLVASYGLMRLIFAPIWGSLSDRVGRKPILMLGVLGNGLALLLFGLSTELWMLFIARSLSGILSSATSPTTMAYISDSTSERDRGGGMGILGAAVGVGTVFGPGLGGWLAGDSLATPFFIASGLSLVSLLLILILLPESLPAKARQQTAGEVKTFRIGELWRALFSPIGILLFMAFLATVGTTTFYGIFGLYALQKFDYGPEQVGTVLMVVGVVSALAQAVLIGPLTRRWGEAAVIKFSLCASSAGFLIMLLGSTYLTVLLTTGLFILVNSLLIPAVTALTSKHATMPQGIAMGLSNSFSSLGRIGGPIWAGFVFDINYDYPYLSGGVIMFIGFLTSLAWVSQHIRQSTDVEARSAAD